MYVCVCVWCVCVCVCVCVCGVCVCVCVCQGAVEVVEASVTPTPPLKTSGSIHIQYVFGENAQHCLVRHDRTLPFQPI